MSHINNGWIVVVYTSCRVVSIENLGLQRKHFIQVECIPFAGQAPDHHYTCPWWLTKRECTSHVFSYYRNYHCKGLRTSPRSVFVLRFHKQWPNCYVNKVLQHYNEYFHLIWMCLFIHYSHTTIYLFFCTYLFTQTIKWIIMWALLCNEMTINTMFKM